MKIKGIPVGTTMPRPDWNQTDPKKADFIHNKPDLVGVPYDGGGEIFNDYENNRAMSPHTKAEGVSCRAGTCGYKLLAVSVGGSGKDYNITVDDASLGNKAIDSYAQGDLLCFDGKNHYYDCLSITAISTDANGNSVINVVASDGRNLTSMEVVDSTADTENWVYVTNKPGAGVPVGSSQGASAGGVNCFAVGFGARAFGKDNKAIGNYACAEGRSNTAYYSAHAEGKGTSATGEQSHSEGSGTKATGSRAHAEGYNTEANGTAAHSEGGKSVANGTYSHAEGNQSFANGESSHAEGRWTIASGKEQHVQGRFNVEDKSNKYAHIVGGGSGDTARKNIHTIDWSGNADFAGVVRSGGKELAAIGDFAPAGYGLGNDFDNVTDKALLDSYYRTGWVRYNNYEYQSLIPGRKVYHAIIRVDSMTEHEGQECCTQTGYISYYQELEGCVIQRTCHNGVWGEWEWVNPPVASGAAEYRTTQRYGQEPIYVRMFSTGILASNNLATITTDVPRSQIVKMEGFVTGEGYKYPLPMVSSGEINAYLLAEDNKVRVKTLSGFDSLKWSARITLWYIKNKAVEV